MRRRRKLSKVRLACREILARHRLLTTDVIAPAAQEHPRTLLVDLTPAALKNAIKGWRDGTAVITRDDRPLDPWAV
jgi:hypothetical protein